MKSLTQHITEKLRIGKDWRPDSVQDIISVFDENYRKAYASNNNPGFLMDNDNQIEMYDTIVNAIKEMGTKLSSFDTKYILELLEDGSKAVAGFMNLEDDDLVVPKGDAIVFTMFYENGAANICLSGRLEFIRAYTEFRYNTADLLSSRDNLYEITIDDFMILLEYVVNHGGMYNKVSLKEFVDKWKKK